MIGITNQLRRLPVESSTYAGAFALFMLTTLGGCGSNELSRTIVQGNVAYDGKPLEKGLILYYPIEGTPGPVSSTPITNGKYTVTNKDGVPIGKHRVVIEGYEAPPPGADPDAGAVQFLPQKYNKQSDIIVEVPAGESMVVRNFELKP